MLAARGVMTVQDDLTANVLEKTLLGLGKRFEAASRNVANMNTPLFAREEVTFEDQLREVVNGPKKLPVKTTDPQHISNVTRTVQEVKPIATLIGYELYRGDSNAVDPETETARVAQTRMMYDAISNRMGGKFRSLRRVLSTSSS